MKRVIIIAEMGENHLGDVGRAKKMIADAAEAGADMVKFQSYLASEVADTDPEKEWFAKVQLSDKAHYELKEYAEQHGVGFLSSPFSVNRAKLLCEGLGLKNIKIASSELLNFLLLDYINEHVETVFLSTGMATLEEIDNALSHLGSVTCYIMHCVTQYPTKPEDANLHAITTLKAAFPRHPIGYSDHTIGIDAGIVAVALGASVVEKHFTFDKNYPEGTDHILSATQEEFKEMVARIRQVEIMLGDGIKQPSPGERKIMDFVRSRFSKATSHNS